MLTLSEENLERAFVRAHSKFGGPTAECNCGREHVAINSDYFEQDEQGEEEKAHYSERAETDPKVVLDYQYDYFQTMEVGGLMFVYGCECKGWERYMNYLVNDRKEITEFLIALSDEIARAAEAERIMQRLKQVDVSKPVTY